VKKIIFLLCAALYFSTGSASAQIFTDTNKTVSSIGTEKLASGEPRTYFSVEEGFDQPCAFGVVYIPHVDGNDIDELWYTTILTAKTTQTQLERFSYTLESIGGNNICTIANRVVLK